jgi:hypothetical protein
MAPKLPPYLRQHATSTEMVLFLADIVFAFGLMLIVAVFYPAGQFTGPLWAEAGLWGIFIGGCLATVGGLVARGRSNASVMLMGSRKMVAADPKYHPLTPRVAPIDVDSIRIDPSWTPERKREVEEAKRGLAWTNAHGDPVAVGYRWGGGLAYDDGQFLIKTYDSVVIEIGSGKAAENGTNVVYICDPFLVSHDLLDPDLLAELTDKTKGKFVRGTTKVYVTLGVNTKWLEFFKQSEIVRRAVNEAQGIHGAAAAFLADVGASIPAFDPANLTKPQFDSFVAHFDAWAKENRLHVEPPLPGTSDGAGLKMYLVEVGKRVHAEKERDSWRSTAERLEAAAHGRAARTEQLQAGKRIPYRNVGPDVEAEMGAVPGAGRWDGYQGE